ncbi:hypothetical protein BDD12DRAFT_806873 [Trichophaea hybrida]|nr:hypothetical protein BDD12DRAFT_806873 [Trichophaea hybrida]
MKTSFIFFVAFAAFALAASNRTEIGTGNVMIQPENGQVISEVEKRDLGAACTQSPNGQMISEVETQDLEGICSQFSNGQVIPKIAKHGLEGACTQHPNRQVTSEKVDKQDLKKKKLEDIHGEVAMQHPNGHILLIMGTSLGPRRCVHMFLAFFAFKLFRKREEDV